MKRQQLFTLFIVLFSFGNAMARDGETAGPKMQYGFVENKGQLTDQNHQPNSAVLYLLNTQGLNVQLRRGGFSYDTYVREVTGSRKMADGKTRPETRNNFHRVDVSLQGSNPNAEMITEGRSADFLNYYNTGNEITGVHHYTKVTYKNIYKGIDLEFTTNPATGKAVEYNFIVAPGADASQIQLHYEGANNTTLADNKINLALNSGTIAETIPASFTAASKTPVNVSYKQIAANTFGFDILAYNKKETLIIDPTPDRGWGTYYGGFDYDFGQAMSMVGNTMYIAGSTQSTAQVATLGAHQGTYAGGWDGFVMSFAHTGTPGWCTYYGGSGLEEVTSVAANTTNVCIGGYTTSNGSINTSGAHQTVYGGGANDGFVVKFSSAGARLWGTYYGGLDDDQVHEVAMDATGFVYACGYSVSTTAIATPLSAQAVNNGGADAFLVKFNGTGARQWATYAGDAYLDQARGVTVDASGNVYLAGTSTNGTVGPYALTTLGSHQPVHGGGLEDNFIEKYNSSGARQWGTFYGGSGSEADRIRVTTDASGNLYISSSTTSANGIATSGAAQTTHSTSQYDGYVAKFSSAGVRQWGTYYGAAGGNTLLNALCVSGGFVYAGGDTKTNLGLQTSNAYQTINNSSASFYEDGCIVKMDAGTSTISWSTYYGDDKSDIVYGIGADASNRVYVAGSSNSQFGLGSTGAYKTMNSGDEDVFVARFHECGTVTGTTIPANSCYGFNSGLVIVTPSGGIAPYQFKAGSGAYQFSATLGGLAPGVHTITIKDDNGCEGTVNETIGSHPQIIKPIITGKTTVEKNESAAYTVPPQSGITFTWTPTPGTVQSGQNTEQAQVLWGSAVGQGSLKVVGSIGQCADSSEMAVTVNPPVSVKDINGSKLSVYPNPTNGSFVLQGDVTGKHITVEVLNAIGRVVYTDDAAITNNSIQKQYNLSHLANGIYTLVLKCDSGNRNTRLVITR